MRIIKHPHLNIVLILLFVSTFFTLQTSAFSHESGKLWNIQIAKLSPLKGHPAATRWYFENGQFNAVSLVDGKIMVLNLEEDVWKEKQSLSVPDCQFVTVQVEDITGDARPEIIAGTTEPGFIYIYEQDFENYWTTNGSAKYIWSSVENLIIGHFTNSAGKEVIAQDNNGFLYFLKNNGQSLDLVWKSPSAWRNIDSYLVTDIDDDHNDEILVAYKSGGIAVLKIHNNAVISVWENYPWGKILAMTYSDWNHDGKSELILTTSQKIIYQLSRSGKGYHLNRTPWQFGYLVENIQIIPGNIPGMLTTDSSGYLHLLEYQFNLKKWVETQVCQTGRIAKIIFDPEASRYLLLETNRNVLSMTLF